MVIILHRTALLHLLKPSHTHTLGNPPSKKRKIEMKSRAEKAIEKAVEAFVKHQTEVVETFKKGEV